MPSPVRTPILTVPVAALCAATALALSSCGAVATVVLPSKVRLASTAAAAANGITVSPLPGTGDASPDTQISFLGAAGTTVSAVSVVGSRSGRHAGRLARYSTGTGESFIPSRPFTAGERVSVSAEASAGGDSQTVHTSFTIAYQAPVDQAQFPQNAGSRAAVQHYHSAPSITPSTVRITTPARPGAAPGYLFLAPYQGDGSAGPMITDQAGNLVWFHRLPAHETATNFRVQQYEGRAVLTWWQGRVLKLGFGQGEDVIYDTSYHEIARVRAGNGYSADLHEIRIEPDGTAWIDIFDPVQMNLRSAGGVAKGVLNDSIVEQIDIKTGLVMWEWHALGHIPLRDSYSAPPKNSTNWDYVHINSVDPGSSGDVLLSARNTWQLYDVSVHTGGFIWRLGGRFSNFKGASTTRTYWQHDAEWQSGGTISVFDNGSDPAKEKQTRGLLLHLDSTAHSVTLAAQFVNPSKRLLASSQGSLVSVAGGNWLMGYGGLPNFTEFSASGAVLLDGTLGRGVQNFRTYLGAWSATPTTRPSLTVGRSGSGALSAWASWNGATALASWRVLSGSSPGALAPGSSVAKAGFETPLALDSQARYVAVQALDASGHILATSASVPTSR